MTYNYALTDSQWNKIKDLLPGKATDPGVTAKDNRLFVNAIIYRYQTGIPWRAMPQEFGDFRVLHTRFSRWAKRGIWDKIFKSLTHDADHEYEMTDSSVVRAHQHSAGAQKKLESKQLGVALGERVPKFTR